MTSPMTGSRRGRAAGREGQGGLSDGDCTPPAKKAT